MARQIPLSCPGHTRPVVDLAFSDITEQGHFLVSACKDGKPMLRTGDTGDWIGTFEGHKGAVWGATLNKDASRAATAAADFSAKLWDSVSGKELASFSHKHIVKTVDFSMDGNKLLTGSNEKKMRIFDLSKAEEDGVLLEPLGGNPKSCLWSNNDQSIICGGDEKLLRLWDTRTLQEVKTIPLETNVLGMELSHDKTVLTIASDKKVLFYDAVSLEPIRDFEMTNAMNSASLNPDKTVFVAGGEDFLVYKFDYNSGEQLESYHGHFGPVHCVRFSPDGELYASGSEDGTLRLWQTTVGKTYGLWKTQETDEKPGIESNGSEVNSNHLPNNVHTESGS